MANQTSDIQKIAIFTVLEEAMKILRENKQLTRDDLTLGKSRWVKASPFSKYGDEYSFENSLLPSSEVRFTTVDDPLNYEEDRTRVALVPDTFTLNFYEPVTAVTPSSLKKHLDLEDYWIDGDGKRHEGNDMGPGIPPYPSLHNFRFRASARDNSGFPVDVDVGYIEPRDDAPPGTSSTLWILTMTRAYPYLTPEMRKQKRDEEREKKREKYGYMNLCTGAICPETGIWEGWTTDGPTDVLRVEKGRKFDVVRTVSIGQSTTPCPMIAGQWMWLCSLEEQGNVTWNGMPFKS